MRSTHPRTRSRIAASTIVSLLASQVGPLLAAQTPAAKPAPAAAATAEESWPRAFSTASGATLVIYQPQVASWVNQKHAVLDAAVSYTAKGVDKPALGTLKVESDTSVAVDDRLVSFSDFKITEPNFPTLPREQLKTVLAEVAASVPLDERVIELDRVTVLVNLDGDPIWTPIAQNDLKSAINTNWDSCPTTAIGRK
jgi:hypothetical protein